MPKKIGRPTVAPEKAQSHLLQIKVNQEFLARIDDWRRAQHDIPVRTEAVRRLVEQALSASAGRKR